MEHPEYTEYCLELERQMSDRQDNGKNWKSFCSKDQGEREAVARERQRFPNLDLLASAN